MKQIFFQETLSMAWFRHLTSKKLRISSLVGAPHGHHQSSTQPHSGWHGHPLIGWPRHQLIGFSRSLTIRQPGEKKVLYDPIIMVFRKSQPGPFLLLMDERLFSSFALLQTPYGVACSNCPCCVLSQSCHFFWISLDIILWSLSDIQRSW